MAGQAPKMRAHLAVCPNVSAAIRADYSQLVQAKKAEGKHQEKLPAKLRLQDLDPPPEDHSAFHRLLLRATLSADMAWQWVDNPEVQELFRSLSSKVSMPGSHVLSGEVLEQAVEEAQETMLKALNESRSGVHLESACTAIACSDLHRTSSCGGWQI